MKETHLNTVPIQSTCIEKSVVHRKGTIGRRGGPIRKGTIGRTSGTSLALAVSAFFAFSPAQANLRGPAEDRYCSQTLTEFKVAIQFEQNRLALANQGGVADAGVCWWHSRFQRAAHYLSIYRPDLPRPTEREAERIIATLADLDAVVVIPGFRDLNEFSRAHWDLIQGRLETWQKEDGLLHGGWIRGLAGSTRTNARTLRKMMDNLYKEVVEKNRIQFTTLQKQGIEAHALLILDMQKRPNGYTITVLDSNRPVGSLNVDYVYGQTTFDDFGGPSVPYIGYTKDFAAMNSAFNRFCGKKLF